MGLSVVTEPSSEPVTTAEAKTHMRVDISADDTLIGNYIKAARQHVEGLTRRALVTQTLDYTLPEFPSDGCGIELPVQPVQSVTYVQYLNEAGSTVSFNYSTSPETPKYDVITDGPRTRIIPKYGLEWPATRSQGNAVTVRFVAGYTTVPEDIRQAILLMVAHWYENREAVVVGPGVVAASIPMTVETLLSPYEMRGF